ncbi:family 1 glycosylhydrolase [Streptomyces sp. NPDC001594]|uniref:family 1 glycosylhydrolase n=1 Tax=Streptomyces sp. NPDC001594 TaxID=3364590 RepID=UPI00369F295B
MGPQGYAPWAPGLGEVLARLHAELPGRKFLVAEIGLGGEDDARRTAYLSDALEEVRRALAGGMDITGVHLWTGVDNYERLDGHTVPFGLFDRDRTPKPSAHLVRSFLRG